MSTTIHDYHTTPGADMPTRKTSHRHRLPHSVIIPLLIAFGTLMLILGINLPVGTSNAIPSCDAYTNTSEPEFHTGIRADTCYTTSPGGTITVTTPNGK